MGQGALVSHGRRCRSLGGAHLLGGEDGQVLVVLLLGGRGSRGRGGGEVLQLGLLQDHTGLGRGDGQEDRGGERGQSQLGRGLNCAKECTGGCGEASSEADSPRVRGGTPHNLSAGSAGAAGSESVPDPRKGIFDRLMHPKDVDLRGMGALPGPQTREPRLPEANRLLRRHQDWQAGITDTDQK